MYKRQVRVGVTGETGGYGVAEAGLIPAAVGVEESAAEAIGVDEREGSAAGGDAEEGDGDGCARARPAGGGARRDVRAGAGEYIVLRRGEEILEGVLGFEGEGEDCVAGVAGVAVAVLIELQGGDVAAGELGQNAAGTAGAYEVGVGRDEEAGYAVVGSGRARGRCGPAGPEAQRRDG